MPTISVIICAHNPRLSVLGQTLNALLGQTLDSAEWEVILIDNASKVAITDEVCPGGLPNLRCIWEETLGLTPARLRGIREAKGELLIFVDDDNVLSADYLEQALGIYRDYPQVGAFGGSIRPVFEEPAPEWTRHYWYLLAIRETPADRISMQYGDPTAEPCGAGLCVHKHVAEHYASLLLNEPIRRALDRAGDSLASAGDMDLIFTAFDLGLGIGRFRSLALDHLIPPGRLTEAYFLRIFEAMAYSGVMLKKIRAQPIGVGRLSWLSRLRHIKRFVCSTSLNRRMMLAEERGQKRALQDWEQHAAK